MPGAIIGDIAGSCYKFVNKAESYLPQDVTDVLSGFEKLKR